jgi:hypothetical protein
MSIVRYVAFYPPTGWEDRPWLDDAACDALVKTARRVGQLYSEEVARLRLVGKASEVRFSPRRPKLTQKPLAWMSTLISLAASKPFA